MTSDEKAWTESALGAWYYMEADRLKVPELTPPDVIMFDDKCRFEAAASKKPPGKGEPHSGKIRLPDGSDMPVGLASSTSRDDKTGKIFFVMALPPIWEAAHAVKPGDTTGLKAVFLHEFSHTRQVPPLQSSFAAAEAQFKTPDDLTDDSIQAKFSKDPAYVAVEEKESRLLREAAHEPDLGKARKLAGEALALMDARQKRWFTGPDAVWKPYDDIFLTMEGVGQWVGYAWLADPNGGAMTPAAAEAKIGGAHWWSQEEGLNLLMVIDKLMPDWPQRVFAAKGALGIDLLREAVTRSPAPAG